jgi:hypothetical protein
MFFHLYLTSVCQDIGIYFSFGVQGSLNKIEKYVKFDPTGSGFDSRGMKLSNPEEFDVLRC